MAAGDGDRGGSVGEQATHEEALATELSAAAAPPPDTATQVEGLLAHVPAGSIPDAAAGPLTQPPWPDVRVMTARPLAIEGRAVTVVVGKSETIAHLAEDVDAALVADALTDRQRVLIEVHPDGEHAAVVGVVQTQRPHHLRLEAGRVEVEGREELLLRSGRAAIRLRPDGDVELVGSRVSAVSRGLFRLVGRVLRLN
ncbi:MAG: hypothetical protein AAF715_29150 [Myxococcota bacterium]